MKQSPVAERDAWNANHKIGEPVIYRTDNGKLLQTYTRTNAHVLSGHTAVIWLEKVGGCVALDRVRGVTEAEARS